MIDPRKVQIYHPPWMGGAKRILLQQMARKTGRALTSSLGLLAHLSEDLLPLICCTPEVAELVKSWRQSGRQFLYWDRGYVRRLGGLFPPLDGTSGYYRVNHSSFQMQRVLDVPSDRWAALKIEVKPWNFGGRNVVVATTDSSYWTLHGEKNWCDKTLVTLRQHTDRPVVVRRKGSLIPLVEELAGAHCLVAHGSNAAIEAVILGCPVIVDKVSAASLVGCTELTDVEDLVYPDREQWLNSLAYSQFSEAEMVDGTVWRMMQ